MILAKGHGFGPLTEGWIATCWRNSRYKQYFHLEFERSGNINPEKKLIFFLKIRKKRFLKPFIRNVSVCEQRIQPMSMFLLEEWYPRPGVVSSREEWFREPAREVLFLFLMITELDQNYHWNPWNKATVLFWNILTWVMYSWHISNKQWN